MASSVSDHPVIGISTYLEQTQLGVWDVRATLLPENYLNCVTEAGGIAILLPPQDGAAAEAVLARVSGLILTGGADVAPELYGAERNPLTDPARTDRDAWELALFRVAERRRVPVLAICRGLQLVNVARGGSLQQHLPQSLGTERYRRGFGLFADNEVVVEGGTALAGVLGDGSHWVQSYHHQGIERLGEGLVESARSADGLAQAIEDTRDGHIVGVQWHPEQDTSDLRLFQDLVRQAQAYRDENDTYKEGNSR